VPDNVGPVRYRERLTVPISWWVLSGLFALSMLLAVGLYLGPVWGIGTAVVSVAAVTAIFLAAAIEVTVDQERLRVGRASIELRYLGHTTALDADAARRRRGPEADARGYLVLRPYVSTAVEIAITDADDPVPYWLVATRRPRALAAALTSAPSSAPTAGSPTPR
jgi:Protein of unknown function (DUF3093)